MDVDIAISVTTDYLNLSFKPILKLRAWNLDDGLYHLEPVLWSIAVGRESRMRRSALTLDATIKS